MLPTVGSVYHVAVWPQDCLADIIHSTAKTNSSRGIQVGKPNLAEIEECDLLLMRTFASDPFHHSWRVVFMTSRPGYGITLSVPLLLYTLPLGRALVLVGRFGIITNVFVPPTL